MELGPLASISTVSAPQSPEKGVSTTSSWGSRVADTVLGWLGFDTHDTPTVAQLAAQQAGVVSARPDQCTTTAASRLADSNPRQQAPKPADAVTIIVDDAKAPYTLSDRAIGEGELFPEGRAPCSGDRPLIRAG